jgi:hypothetical protein
LFRWREVLFDGLRLGKAPVGRQIENEAIEHDPAAPSKAEHPVNKTLPVNVEADEPAVIRVNGPYTLVHKEPVVAVPLLEVVWIEGHPLVPYRALVVGHGRSLNVVV